MRATVSAADFAEAAARVGKGSLEPIRVEVRSGTLTLTGGDKYGDVILAASIDATGTEDGSADAPAVLVSAAAQMRSPGTATLSLDGGELRLTNGRKTSSLPILAAERSTSGVTDADFSAGISADAKSFSAAMRAAAKWTADPVYGGAIAGVRVAYSAADAKLSIVATDRYAIRHEEIACEGQDDFCALIPGPVAAAWPSAAGEITLSVKGGRVEYAIPEARMFGQVAMLAHEYPKLDHLLVASGFASSVTVRTAALTEAIATVSAQNHGAFDLHYTSDGGVRLDSAETDLTNNGVGQISAQLAGEDILAATGDSFVARVNRKFAGVLNIGSEIRIGYLEPKRPIFGFSDNIHVALMPLARA